MHKFLAAVSFQILFVLIGGVLPLAAAEVLSVSFQTPGKSTPTFNLWLVDGAGKRAGFPPDGAAVKEIPDSEVDKESLTPSDPEASAEDAAKLESTRYSASVVHPEPGLSAVLYAPIATDFSIEVNRYKNGEEVLRKPITGKLKAGQTKRVSLPR